LNLKSHLASVVAMLLHLLLYLMPHYRVEKSVCLLPNVLITAEYSEEENIKGRTANMVKT
jgi:hypothetical protein